MAVRSSSWVSLLGALALTAAIASAVPAAAAPARPTITRIAPASGPTSGGTRVRLVGTNFLDVQSVTFGGTAAQIVGVAATHRSMTVTAPQSASQRTVAIRLKTAGGSVTRTNAFTYTAPWQASWHDPQTIAAPVDSPLTLDCPTSHCYGMDRYGNFLDSGAGTGTWIDHGSPSGDSAVEAQNSCNPQPRYVTSSCASLSCPQVGFCLTVDDQGRPLIWRGATWQAYPSLNPAGATAFDHTPVVSCASSTFCMVQDSGGDYSTFDGTSWAPVTTLDGAPVTTAAQINTDVNHSTDSAVSCAGNQCMTVTEDDAYHYVGGAWTQGGDQQWAVPDGGVGPDVQHVSCANVAHTGTQLLCAAGGGDSTIVYSDGSWSGIDYKRPSQFVSCRADGRCLATSPSGLTYEYGDSTQSHDKWGWSTSFGIPTGDRLGAVFAVACGSAPACRVSIGNGFSATVTPSTHKWSSATSILAADTGISALGCTITASAARYCLAGTRGPDLVTDDGSGWAPPTESFDRGERTAAVSCFDKTSFCMAIANNNHFASQSNHYAVYRNGTLSTHSMITGTYRALSCWSATGCYAVSLTRDCAGTARCGP